MLSLIEGSDVKSANVRKVAVPLHVRPIQPSDAELIQEGFERLSERSRYSRFHAGMRRIPDALLRYLTEVDGVDHVALVAFEQTAFGPGQGVAVGRFVRNKDAPETAELAVTVVDAFQGRGIARQLLGALSEEASERGIHTFTMDVLADNTRARRLLRRLGAIGTGSHGDVITFHLPIVTHASAA